MSTFKPLAVQSFCLRGFKDPADCAQKVRDIGLEHVELCGAHADFTDESTFEALCETFANAGVTIISIGVQSFKGDAENEEKFFTFAQMAGAKTMSVSFAPGNFHEAVKTAESLAETYDIRMGIHNHGGRHWLGSRQILASVLSHAGPRLGLMLDTAWALDSGEDPLQMIDQFGDRLAGVHIKDFVFDRARKHQDVVVGTGNLDLVAMFAKLKEKHFDGELILEYEGDVDNPVPALIECVEAITPYLS